MKSKCHRKAERFASLPLCVGGQPYLPPSCRIERAWQRSTCIRSGIATYATSANNQTNNLLLAMKRAENYLRIEKVCPFSIITVCSQFSSNAQPEDWYSVTLADLKEIDFPSRVTKPQLAELLTQLYPQYPWESLYLLRGRYAQQKRLEKAVHFLFPVIAYLSFQMSLIFLLGLSHQSQCAKRRKPTQPRNRRLPRARYLHPISQSRV